MKQQPVYRLTVKGLLYQHEEAYTMLVEYMKLRKFNGIVLDDGKLSFEHLEQMPKEAH